jgi:dATP/dGTP diphosphohydrolase
MMAQCDYSIGGERCTQVAGHYGGHKTTGGMPIGPPEGEGHPIEPDPGSPTIAQPRKLDAGKPRIDLIPAEQLMELGTVFAIGAKKYEDDNWRAGDGLEWDRLYAATMRHLLLFSMGEDIDQEDGQPHLMAAAFGCFTLRWLSLHRPHMDKRRRFDPPPF